MQAIKTAIRSAVRACGYEFSRFGVGKDPFFDMQNLAPDASTIFDVGANAGQTVQNFRKRFSRAVVHSFEPSPSVFATMAAALKGYERVHLNNMAVGSRIGTVAFNENVDSKTSSVLESVRYATTQRTNVPIITLDDYCQSRSIQQIDILKSDTQGYDLEVLQGASRLLSEGRVRLVFIELNFGPLYKEQGNMDEIYGLLRRSGFSLVSFYPIAYSGGLASWADALFIRT